MSRDIDEEVIRQKLSLNAAIISSKNYEAKNPEEFIGKYYELYNEFVMHSVPWLYTKDTKSGKAASRAFVNSADKLVARYKELFGKK